LSPVAVPSIFADTLIEIQNLALSITAPRKHNPNPRKNRNQGFRIVAKRSGYWITRCDYDLPAVQMTVKINLSSNPVLFLQTASDVADQKNFCIFKK